MSLFVLLPEKYNIYLYLKKYISILDNEKYLFLLLVKITFLSYRYIL